MPAEMLIVVSSHVAKEDLNSFRLACKATAAASEDFFGAANFSMLKHLFTTHSLQILCSIASHPRFSRHVKEL